MTPKSPAEEAERLALADRIEHPAEPDSPRYETRMLNGKERAMIVAALRSTSLRPGRAEAPYPKSDRDSLGRRIDPAPMPEALKDTIATCYGLLWEVETDDKRVHRARRGLLQWLTKDEQGRGITNARGILLASREIPDTAQTRQPADGVVATCECGFSSEACVGNPCMRKKVHLAGLTPGSKWPQGAPTGAVAGEPADVTVREALRKLVDVVWNEATESTAVPSTKWADKLIDKSGALSAVRSAPAVEAGAVAWPTEDQVWDCIRLTFSEKIAAKLSFKRWKDGIDIDYPTSEAMLLAKQFFAMGVASASPPANPQPDRAGEAVAWRFFYSDGKSFAIDFDRTTADRWVSEGKKVEALGVIAPPANPPVDERAKVVEDIIAERRRQQDVEGWSVEHDDSHISAEMAMAAAVYALTSFLDTEHSRNMAFTRYWPWDRKYFKPKGGRRDLLRAAALIVAEIERLDRALSDTTKPAGAV